jgi:aryl sulfotransferase
MATLPGGAVWIASYPKSGNTWMRILLSNLTGQPGAPRDINNLSLPGDSMASSRAMFEDQTLVDSHLLLPHEIEAWRPAVHDANAVSKNSMSFIKGHDCWTHLADGTPLLGRAARAALYLTRDPRDVAVSFAFYLAISLDRTIELMNRPDSTLPPSSSHIRQRLGDWSGHVRSWLDQTDVPVLPIRYEDLQADTAGALRRALHFLGISFEDFEDGTAEKDAVSHAVRHADFAELQRQERDRGFAESSGKQEFFFRQGRVGDWRNHLSEVQTRRIESAHGTTMERLGYAPATERETMA